MTPSLPRDQIWFAVHWRRLWPVNRQGKMAIAKYWAGFLGSFFVGALLAVFVNPILGLALIVIGGVISFAWLIFMKRRHTDYAVSYDDYFREQNNA